MGTWEYRVVREEEGYEIAEVDSRDMNICCTADGPHGADKADLMADLQAMNAALRKPVLAWNGEALVEAEPPLVPATEAERRLAILAGFAEKMSDQQPLEREMVAMVDEDFWDLIGPTEQTKAVAE